LAVSSFYLRNSLGSFATLAAIRRALPLRASLVRFVCQALEGSGQHYRTHWRSFRADFDMDRTVDRPRHPA
jgi:hypothetical protein